MGDADVAAAFLCLRVFAADLAKAPADLGDDLPRGQPGPPVVTCQIRTGISGHTPQISPAEVEVRQPISPADDPESRRPRQFQYRLPTLQIVISC